MRMKLISITMFFSLLCASVTLAADAAGAAINTQVRAEIRRILQGAKTTDYNVLRQQVISALAPSGVIPSDQVLNDEVAAYVAQQLNAVPGAGIADKTPATSSMVKRPLDVFGPIDFGAGIGLMSDFGSEPRVKNATVDTQGIVRIEEESELAPQLMLEAHIPYRFTKPGGFFSEIEVGPYIGILPGGENVIKGIGGGVMLGFRRLEANPDKSEPDKPLLSKPGAIRIGVGVMVEPGVQVLAEGIEENRPLPTGETLRYREKDMLGLQVLVSFGI